MSFESAPQRFNVVACTLAQRRKAAIQERVKKLHLCLCLVSISQSLLLQLFSLEQTVLPSGTRANVHLDQFLVCCDQIEFVVAFLLPRHTSTRAAYLSTDSSIAELSE